MILFQRIVRETYAEAGSCGFLRQTVHDNDRPTCTRKFAATQFILAEFDTRIATRQAVIRTDPRCTESFCPKIILPKKLATISAAVSTHKTVSRLQHNHRMNRLKSSSLTIDSSCLRTYSLSILTVLRFISGASKLTSSNSRSRIVCNRRAPMFCVVWLI